MPSGDARGCPSCGAGTPEDARFCPMCGARLAQLAALPEERKTVTTLFCDLVGFTAMGEQADPEDVDACLRSFGALAREVIERYGGSVEKFIGDAVVGVFGVPVVHEDDPERAVRAALRLLESLDDAPPAGRHADRGSGRRHDRRAPGGARRGPGARQRLRGGRRGQHVRPPRGLGGAGRGGRRRADTPAHRGRHQLRAAARRVGQGEVATAGAVAGAAPGGAGEPRPGARPPVAAGRSRQRARLPRRASCAGSSTRARRRSPSSSGSPASARRAWCASCSRSSTSGREFITWRQGRCVPYGEDRDVLGASRGGAGARRHPRDARSGDGRGAPGAGGRGRAGPPPAVREAPPARRPRRARGRARGELRRLAAVPPRGGRAPPARPGPGGPALGGRGAARVRRLRGRPRRRTSRSSWSGRLALPSSSSTPPSRRPAAA